MGDLGTSDLCVLTYSSHGPLKVLIILIGKLIPTGVIDIQDTRQALGLGKSDFPRGL